MQDDQVSSCRTIPICDSSIDGHIATNIHSYYIYRGQESPVIKERPGAVLTYVGTKAASRHASDPLRSISNGVKFFPAGQQILDPVSLYRVEYLL